MANKKLDFAQQIQTCATKMAQAIEAFQKLDGIYYDRGYNPAGNDPITDADLVSLGITASDVASGITLAEQVEIFKNGQSAPTVADYGATMNKLRTDS